MWEELDDQIRGKLRDFAGSPQKVYWSLRAERDIAANGSSKGEVLESVCDHIDSEYPVYTDIMDNDDQAWIFKCLVDTCRWFVKCKWIELEGEEILNIFSAHPDDR